MSAADTWAFEREYEFMRDVEADVHEEYSGDLTLECPNDCGSWLTATYRGEGVVDIEEPECRHCGAEGEIA